MLVRSQTNIQICYTGHFAIFSAKVIFVFGFVAIETAILGN